jgi:hypothetical protein
LNVQLDPPGLYLGQIQNVIDQSEEKIPGADNTLVRLDLLGIPVGDGVFVQHLRYADDGVQRCPQLVAHVGQELTLGDARLLGLPSTVFELGVHGGDSPVETLQLRALVQKHRHYEKEVAGELDRGIVLVIKSADDDGYADGSHCKGEIAVVAPAIQEEPR